MYVLYIISLEKKFSCPPLCTLTLNNSNPKQVKAYLYAILYPFSFLVSLASVVYTIYIYSMQINRPEEIRNDDGHGGDVQGKVTYMILLRVHRMLYRWNSLAGLNHIRYLSSLPRLVLPLPYTFVCTRHGFPFTFPRNSKSSSSCVFSNTSPFDVCSNTTQNTC